MNDHLPLYPDHIFGAMRVNVYFSGVHLHSDIGNTFWLMAQVMKTTRDVKSNNQEKNVLTEESQW